jgi:hypothetical protein
LSLSCPCRVASFDLAFAFENGPRSRLNAFVHEVAIYHFYADAGTIRRIN